MFLVSEMRISGWGMGEGMRLKSISTHEEYRAVFYKEGQEGLGEKQLPLSTENINISLEYL